MLIRNIQHFEFLVFAEAMCILPCAKDNISKVLKPAVNLNNMYEASEEFWEIVPLYYYNSEFQRKVPAHHIYEEFDKCLEKSENK